MWATQSPVGSCGRYASPAAEGDDPGFIGPGSSIAARTTTSKFGVGEHFCMGAHVARVELETIFRHLLTRLESFEPSGPVERLSSAVNGGLKHLPLRYRLV